MARRQDPKSRLRLYEPALMVDDVVFTGNEFKFHLRTNVCVDWFHGLYAFVF